MFEKLIILFVGWSLGVFSPLITDALRRRRENAAGRKAIRQELSELKFTLVVAAHSLGLHLGSLNREKIERFKNTLMEYPNDGPVFKFLESANKQLAFSDEQLKEYLRVASSKDGLSQTLQIYSTPVLDSRLDAIWSFDAEDQQSLLAIKRSLDILKEIVERARYFTNLTFSAMPTENHERAVGNVTGCYRQYVDRALQLTEMISSFRHK